MFSMSSPSIIATISSLSGATRLMPLTIEDIAPLLLLAVTTLKRSSVDISSKAFSRVLSVDASSNIRTLRFFSVCACMDLMQLPIYFSAL